LSPNIPDFYTSRGALYRLTGRFKEAQDDYDKALELGQKDYTIYYNIGLLYQTLSQFDKAIESYKKAE
jgi:tetratricopeptide (TPR) repeat protein